MLGKLAGWAKQVGESTHLRRLNIGPRLTLCFLFIILALLVGNAVSLWQFHLARIQADRLSGVDQELIAVLQAHTSLMSFYERLDVLAHFENTGQLVAEVEALRDTILQESQRSRDALSRLPPGVQLDPALLPTLLSIQDTLPAELEAIAALAIQWTCGAVSVAVGDDMHDVGVVAPASGLCEYKHGKPRDSGRRRQGQNLLLVDERFRRSGFFCRVG